MPHEQPEIGGEFVGEAEPRPGRLVAVATVLTTLAAATTGYLQATALRDHAESAVRAERLAALAVNVSAASADQAQVQINRYRTVRAEEQQSARATGAEAVRWQRVAQATTRDTRAIAATQQIAVGCSARSADCESRPLPVICSPHSVAGSCGAGAWYSPERDPAFPTRYEQAAQWESYRLLALREVANQEADRSEARFAHLAAALTMLAVAVFLFGYSLTPQGRRQRPLFSTVATGFALFGCGWALAHGLSGSQRPPPSAAASFANGEVALNDGDYRKAITEFQHATDRWPKAVSAYADLAQAEFLKNEGELAGVLTLPKKNGLAAAIAADRKAIANGSESPTVRSDEGSNLLFLGLLTHDDGRVREARGLSDEAATRFAEQLGEGRHPGAYLISARFSVAEADLALGASAARDEYCAAIHQMLDLDEEVSPYVIAMAAGTDLRLIVHAHPGRKAEAAELKRQVDRAASRGAAGCAAPGASA